MDCPKHSQGRIFSEKSDLAGCMQKETGGNVASFVNFQYHALSLHETLVLEGVSCYVGY
jgi:hypothetical protein